MSTLSDTKVLVVDDFESMRRIMKQVLNEIGFRDVTLADNGASALALLKKGDFGLVLTDWNMPEMEGIELLRAVRADPRLKSIPILMVTAEAKRERIIEAVKAGVNDYIIKPFTADTVRVKVEKALAGAGTP